MIESECNTFPHFANCRTGSYQGLILNKTTKSVARKGNRFFVLRYTFGAICAGTRYVCFANEVSGLHFAHNILLYIVSF